MPEKLQELKNAFAIEGELCDAVILSGGIVNDTYRADIEYRGAVKSYVFQRVSSYVYRRPDAIMSNIAEVQGWLSARGVSLLPRYLELPGGGNFYTDADGEHWRIMNYIRSVCFAGVPADLKRQGYDPKLSSKIISGAGKAYGTFSRELSGMDPSRLLETVPDFHNTPRRIASMLRLAEELGVQAEETEFIRSVSDKASEIYRCYEAGLLKRGIVHNDTKLSNVLFGRESLEPLAVIDLDTMMPGLLIYDFADCARSACKAFGPRGIYFSEENYRVLEDAYLSEAEDVLSSREKDSLRLAVYSISVELAARYLEDHMRGDRYFKTSYPGQNLDKARELIRYVQTMDFGD
ncbi:MAG: aminoglycoside phosphotransferase family protein [Firmicutes bacterium]|nr:aminoglycoside phosphotransferase family protein [Bacillota bacterium]